MNAFHASALISVSRLSISSRAHPTATVQSRGQFVSAAPEDFVLPVYTAASGDDDRSELLSAAGSLPRRLSADVGAPPPLNPYESFATTSSSSSSSSAATTFAMIRRREPGLPETVIDGDDDDGLIEVVRGLSPDPDSVENRKVSFSTAPIKHGAHQGLLHPRRRGVR
uniref:Secreted protein n=1 Tax=Steinernema glaseri TaxID=37863 RepID=A0A1I7YBA6_9BILA